MSGVFAKPRRGIKRSLSNRNSDTKIPFDIIPNPGKYGFSLNHSISSKEVTYLFDTNMLYIKYGTAVPIRFNLARDQSELPAGCVVRTMMVYKYKHSDTDLRELPRVTRCYNHQEKGVDGLHVVTSTLTNSSLKGDPSSGLYVEVPLSSMRRTEEGYTGMYRFLCYTSCFEDPIQAVFELEAGGELLGREVVDVRVCACPNRDKKVARQRLSLDSSPGDENRKSRKVQTPCPIEDSDSADAYFRDFAMGSTVYFFNWELTDPCMFSYLCSLRQGYELDKKRFLSKDK